MEQFPNQMNPPTGGVYHAVFHFRTSVRLSGTAFAIKVGNKVYLVTAAHLVVPGLNEIQVFNDANWLTFPSLLRYCDNFLDLAIFDFPIELMSPPSFIEAAKTDDYFIGQHAFFLGYPLGDFALSPAFGDGVRPLPFVKWGAISMVGFGKSKGTLVLDAYNLEGFSGGPIVVNARDGSQVAIGIVTGSREVSRPVESINGDSQSNGMIVFQNAGLLGAVSIAAIRAVIEQFDSPHTQQT